MATEIATPVYDMRSHLPVPNNVRRPESGAAGTTRLGSGVFISHNVYLAKTSPLFPLSIAFLDSN